jgi:ribosomal protein S18 acetylase RimI-like enzyme
MPEIEIEYRQTADRALLRRLLRHKPMDTAYMLGDLQEPFFSDCKWFIALRLGEPLALILLYKGLSTPTLLFYGDQDLFAALLAQFFTLLPTQGYAKIPNEHRKAFERYYEIVNARDMWCMGLSAATFRPMSLESRDIELRLLTPEDSLEEIYALYNYYPDNFFEPRQLQSGVYYGAFVTGQLASIAGTHVYAPSEGVAALGNIVTAAPYRSRGLAAACCSALVGELQNRGCHHIALHVAEENAPAIACYQHIGFELQSKLLDTKYK